jgi:hypothetical protein
MQLLDTKSNGQPDRVPKTLQVALEDIVNHVRIEDNFGIRHPDYKTSDMPEQAVELFKKLPTELQHKYISSQLQNFLYGIYYNGCLKSALAADAETNKLLLAQNLENSSFLGMDSAFYERLHQSNQGKGYFDPGWQVLGDAKDGSGDLVIVKGGLFLHIDRDLHLQPETRSAKSGDLVAIRLPKNRVQNGFYMAIGDAGSDSRTGEDSVTVRVYFHFDSEGAVAVMASLTEKLNQLFVPFSFKTLYNPSDYKRYDSAVLYFDSNYYDSVKFVLEDIYKSHSSYFQAEIPLFTKILAPGVGLAEEPNHKFNSKESFGTHRCQIVANSLLETWQKGDNSPKARMAAILKNFSVLGIELQRSYLNADSEDIYAPLKI